MKLFARYNRINLLATVIVFLLTGLAYFFLLRYILIDQVDEDLKIEQHEILNYAAKYQRFPEVIAVKDQRISYTPVATDGGKQHFSIVQLQEGASKETEAYRQLLFYAAQNNQWYAITVSKSLEGTDALIRTIAIITLLTILLILAISLVINRFVLKKLWHPFHETLAAMRRFELSKKEAPVFPATTIDEFKVMNETLKQATSKAGRDYQYLKEFTENAAHELQTPLSIIQSKLDVLIQDEALTASQGNILQAAYEAIQKLSKLNQGLLLMAKIENGQFGLTSTVNLSEKLKEKIAQFEELINAKNITLETSYDSNLVADINPLLADIMLNNLLSNAIRHNHSGGSIVLHSNQQGISIKNTGSQKALDAERIFQRFSKDNTSNEGIGLGLAILQQAAEVSHFRINYQFEKENLHHFTLTPIATAYIATARN
ncbi:MAG: HAMP domain-containing sensor histidine kinase [Chitinophagaceae bacterium]